MQTQAKQKATGHPTNSTKLGIRSVPYKSKTSTIWFNKITTGDYKVSCALTGGGSYITLAIITSLEKRTNF